MLLSTLLAALVGDLAKDWIKQKAHDAVLQAWQNYTQGNDDVQAALRQAFINTPTALAFALSPDSWLVQQFKFTPPKVSREFAAAIETRYLQPFCGQNQDLRQKLRRIGKAQCQQLAQVLGAYPFHALSGAEAANLLYHVRFISDAETMRQQAHLTKTALRAALRQARLDADFIEFLLFPNDGAGALYEGVLCYFEEAVKANDRLSRALAHFERQQILANAQQTQRDSAALQQKLDAVQAQLSQQTEAVERARLTQQAARIEGERRRMAGLLALLAKNLELWQQADAELQTVRAEFGLMSRELAGRFDLLQHWLNGEFDAVKTEVRGGFSEISRLMRLYFEQLGVRLDLAPDAAEVVQHFIKPDRLWERYECLERLSVGAFAEVYKVRHRLLRRVGVVKALLEKHRLDQQAVARFWGEGHVLGLLSAGRRDIVNVYDMGQSADGEYFIELEFAPGRTLQAALAQDGALAPLRAVGILRQLAAAFGHIHAHNIVYRDLHPGNLMLGDRDHLTLLDFNLVKRLDDPRSGSKAGEFYGNAEYAAPEQFDAIAFGEISPRTDVYALGILGYRLLTNRLPFECRSHSEWSHAHCHKPLPPLPAESQIPAAIAAMLVTCAQKRPEDRFQSMAEVETALAAIPEQAHAQEALGEYREWLFSYLPEITAKQRQVLERRRAKLGVSKAAADALESALREAIAAEVEDIGDYEEIVDEIEEIGAYEEIVDLTATAAGNASKSVGFRPPSADTGAYENINLAELLRPQRDPFETPEEFQARLQTLLNHFNRGARQHDPHYQAGVATLRKDGYDIAAGRFPLAIAWRDWAKPLPKPFGAWITAARDDAKALWQEGAQKPVFLTLRLTAAGCAAQAAAVIGIGAEWELTMPRVETAECLAQGARFEFVAIPGGTFWMGSPDGVGEANERPRHQVTVAPFYIGTYPVTQAQWQAVMGNNPSNFKGAERPVEQVSWNDCQEFVKKLNANPPHSPLNQGGQRGVFRLPTEAEWEYACRAGTETAYSFGDDPAPLGDYGWFDGNSGGETHPVGQKQPNAFGLYDLHGNVWEWVVDTWHDNYDGAPTDGSVWGNLGDGKAKVLRGGGYSNDPNYCRSAYRNRSRPDLQGNRIGLRVVVAR